MFGDRMPLFQQEEGASGGGATVGDVLRTGKNLIQGGFTGAAVGEAGRQYEKFIDPNKDIPEADDQVGSTVAPVGGGGEAGASRSGRKPTQSPVRPDHLKKKQAGSFWQGESTIKPGLTPTEQELKQESEAAILKSERATRIAEMQVQGYAEGEMIDFANIHSIDAEEGRRLHREHFSKAKQRSDQLYKRVQEARTMQVDPFNWHKSIGRGGRVASAFSMLTGQIAAGAGNPSSAMKMMDSAIERDIAAQQTNIENEYNNLKLVKGLNENDRAMFLEELGSLNETRAVRYASMLSKIEAAKQHAINESAYNSYKVMGDHYTLKLLEALQAARAEILTLHGKGPIQASKVRMLQKQIANIQKDLTDPYIQRQMNAQEAAGALQAGADQAAALPAEPSLAPAPGRAGAVRGRRAAPAPTGGTPPGQATAGKAGTGPGTESVPQEPAERRPISDERERAEGMSRLETQEEADKRVAQQTSARSEEDAILERKAVNPRQFGKQAMVRGSFDQKELHALMEQGGANEWVIENDGYGRAEHIGMGEQAWEILGWTPALNAVIRGEKFTMNDTEVKGFHNVSDAKAFAQLVPPPLRSAYPGRPNAYQEAYEQWEFNRDHYEIYEAPTGSNSMQAGGRTYRVQATSSARDQDSFGKNHYNTIKGKIQETHEFIDKLKRVGDTVRRVGIGSGGWFNAEEGSFSIPGWNSTDPGTKLLINDNLRLAMGFIKSEDETARLSDNDIIIGEKAMSIMQGGKKAVLMDLVQGLDGNWTDNTVRRAMERYMKKLAVNAQKAIIQQYQDDIVYDYNTSVIMKKESEEAQRWLNTTPGWDTRVVTP